MRAVFTEHHDAVWRYATRRVEADVAEDVVAETFLTAWRRLEELPDPALPWLFGVARRVIANQRRAAQRRNRLRLRIALEPAVAEADEGPVVAALETLSPDDQEALRLVYWDGLRPADAAVAQGCSAVAMRVRLSRARSRLAAALARADAPIPTTARTTHPIVKET